MIVTIDGPAGAGKSSAARQLAERLGFEFLDTGAMYRAVAYAASVRGHDWEKSEDLAPLAESLDIQLQPGRVSLDGQDVSAAIRTPEVTGVTHYAANNPAVRAVLVQKQRDVAAGKDVVTEGRDQGTVVFPNAECKIFLTATAEERARRRLRDLERAGNATTLEEVLSDQTKRDESDEQRECGPLVQAEDALVLVTDNLPEVEVVDHLEMLVRQRMP